LADKAINQLICFQKLKRLLLQWKLEKAAQWFGVFVTSEVKPATLLPLCTIFRSISEKQSKSNHGEFDQISETIVEGTLPKRNYMDAIKANSGR
jgi:hypothetical protein